MADSLYSTLALAMGTAIYRSRERNGCTQYIFHSENDVLPYAVSPDEPDDKDSIIAVYDDGYLVNIPEEEDA